MPFKPLFPHDPTRSFETEAEALQRRAREDGFVLGLRLAADACQIAGRIDLARALTDIALDKAGDFAHQTHHQLRTEFIAAVARVFVERNGAPLLHLVRGAE